MQQLKNMEVLSVEAQLAKRKAGISICDRFADMFHPNLSEMENRAARIPK
jgi:hypothetical protein